MMAVYGDSDRDGYRMVLMDGYINAKILENARYEARIDSCEQIMADHLSHLAKRRRRSNPRGARFIPLHIFVVGDENWHHAIPEPFQTIHGGATPRDMNPHEMRDYRVIIAGHGPSQPPHAANLGLPWNNLRRNIGMYRAQHHRSRKGFREQARTLLEPLHEYYVRERAPPVHVLDRLGVPFASSVD